MAIKEAKVWVGIEIKTVLMYCVIDNLHFNLILRQK